VWRLPRGSYQVLENSRVRALRTSSVPGKGAVRAVPDLAIPSLARPCRSQNTVTMYGHYYYIWSLLLCMAIRTYPERERSPL